VRPHDPLADISLRTKAARALRAMAPARLYVCDTFLEWASGVLVSPPRDRIVSHGRAGASWALHPTRPVPRVVRHVKGSKGHLRQHKTCDTSNAGTGSQLP
jgi:hypothetical protein